jgi:hypothetical protein
MPSTHRFTNPEAVELYETVAGVVALALTVTF